MKNYRKQLTKKEKKIYDAIMQDFPKTAPAAAYDIAIQGGIKFNYIGR